MKKQSLAILVTMIAVVVVSSAASADTVTISGVDFNNSALVTFYHGTYDAVPSGHMHLAYTIPDDNAVVGAIGPFGTLTGLSMSFDYSNLVGNNGYEPYAAFGVSVDGLWAGSTQRFMIIAMSGNQLNDSTLVHVVNTNTGANYIPMAQAITLGQLLSLPYGGVLFGDMNVLRAYADFGAASGTGTVTGSVNINSITVSSPASVPDPGSALLLFGTALAGLVAAKRRWR